MGRKGSPITLTAREQMQALAIVNKGKHSARKIKRANILLYLHAGKTLEEASKLAGSSKATLSNIKKRYKQEGFSSALEERSRGGRPIEINSGMEADLTTIACSQAPQGRSRWTVRLLSDSLIELGYTKGSSKSNVAKMLKKPT